MLAELQKREENSVKLRPEARELQTFLGLYPGVPVNQNMSWCAG